MSIVVAGIIITACALQYYYLRTSRQIRHLELEAHTPLYTEFLEISSGLRHIRAFGWEEEFLKESYKLIDTSQKPFYMLYSIQRWLGFVLDCMSGVLAIGLVVIGIRMPQSTSQAGLGLAFMQIIAIGPTLDAFINAWTRLETSLGSLLRIHLFNNETPVEPRDTLTKLPREWPQEGKIEFEDVTARYKYGPSCVIRIGNTILTLLMYTNSPDDGDKIALRNVSFIIAPGQKVGLRGRTGR